MAEVGTIHTEAIYAVYLGQEDDTRAAVRVAHQLSRALGAPLTVVGFDRRPSAEATEFSEWLARNDIAARLRVFVSRNWRHAVAMAFRRHSLIVVGGRRRWWPTRATRLRRTLEAAGHFVVFVDEAGRAA